MPRLVASDLILHCLTMFHKKDTRLKLVIVLFLRLKTHASLEVHLSEKFRCDAADKGVKFLMQIVPEI